MLAYSKLIYDILPVHLHRFDVMLLGPPPLASTIGLVHSVIY